MFIVGIFFAVQDWFCVVFFLNTLDWEKLLVKHRILNIDTCFNDFNNDLSFGVF